MAKLPGICSNCKLKNSIISVHEDPRFKYGLSEKLLFHCSDCSKYITSFNSSKTTNSKLSSAYEINIRYVLASISIGRAGLSKFCSTMDLPPPVTPSCYNNMLKKLSTCSVEQANNIMKESDNRLKDIYCKGRTRKY